MKLNTKNLSKEALEILALGKGYRSDDQSEMIIFQSPENILDFEINELENDDIPDFMSDNFGLDSGSTIKSRKAVGSSSRMSGVSCASDLATITLCRSPSESEERARRRRCAVPVRRMASSTSFWSVSERRPESGV